MSNRAKPPAHENRFIVSIPHHRTERLNRRCYIGGTDLVVGNHPEVGRPRMMEQHPLLLEARHEFVIR